MLALERMEAPAPVAVDWPPSEVPPQTLDALGLPIAGLRLTSQACEMDWLEPVSGWQVHWYDAQGEQITSQRGAGVRRHTTPYGRPAPWTLELSYEGHSPLHTLALDEAGKILTYAYGGYPDDVVLGTEQAMPPRRTFDAEREVEARIRQILPNVDGGATGAAYAEIRRDAGRIRKYVQTEQGETYYFTAATDGSRILSMRWGNGEPQHYMDLTIAPTREEATAHAQAILTDIAGWLPEEVYTPSLTVVDRPSRGERYSYEFYGASQTDAKDIWYGIYIGGQRHLNAFWRMDVLEDAPVQRPLTEAERAELAQYACAFVEETRGMYPISGLQAAVEDQAQVYGFGEVAHVNVDDAEGGRDVLYIRLAPRSVLYQNRADVASAASGDAQPKVAQKEAEGEWKQAQALLDAVGNEERIYTSKDRGSDTRFQGGEGKERFTLVMGEDGSLISYALKRLEDEPIGTQKLPEAQRRSLEAHARDVGEQLLGQAQVSVGPEASAYKWGDAAKARVWDAQSGQGYDLVLGLEPMRVLGVERRAPAVE